MLLSMLSVHRLALSYVTQNRFMHRGSIALRTLSMSAGVRSLLQRSSDTNQFLFVGGKGGVGKTSTASAIAVKLSDEGLRTLVVSTDPAHSLGDALDVKLTAGVVTPISTETNLCALEIDIDEAMNSFRESLNDFDPEKLSLRLGIPKEILTTLGLDDLNDLLVNPPPGIDEVVALINIFQYADINKSGRKFDRIVIDTAPTGHTIRLLQLPEFLDSTIMKVLKFRSKISTALNSFQNMFGLQNSDSDLKSQSLFEELDNFQRNLQMMRQYLKDKNRTQFIIVTIPTVLAMTETKRLIKSLQEEDIYLSTIVCNQVISDAASARYIDSRKYSQKNALLELKESKSPTIELTEVPYFDTEVNGIYGLRFFASVAHKPVPNTATNPIMSRKLCIFGGKGGVGKTTSAASWAVQLADSGMRTLVVSTDPAHSLGDALQESLSGTPRLLDTTAGGGQLWALEVDPKAAIEEFKEIAAKALTVSQDTTAEYNGQSGGKLGGIMSALGLSSMKSDLTELVSGISDPPPGTDEVVALTLVVRILEEGWDMPDGTVVRFDRVVLDTAPTGHTLRMLTLPAFLRDFIRKLRTVRDKVSNPADNDSDRLKSFEDRMTKLENILHSPTDTEFTVVTIPTQVAVAETKRLLESLKDQDILVRRLIVNQVITTPQGTGSSGDSSEDLELKKNKAADAYLNRMRDGQRRSMDELKRVADESSVPVVFVPYYEVETRTVYGARAIAAAIFASNA